MGKSELGQKKLFCLLKMLYFCQCFVIPVLVLTVDMFMIYSPVITGNCAYYQLVNVTDKLINKRAVTIKYEL